MMTLWWDQLTFLQTLSFLNFDSKPRAAVCIRRLYACSRLRTAPRPRPPPPSSPPVQRFRSASAAAGLTSGKLPSPVT